MTTASRLLATALWGARFAGVWLTSCYTTWGDTNEAHVSAMKTRRAVSKLDCSWRHASRCVTISGGFCPVACSVFFARNAVSREAALERAEAERQTCLQEDGSHLVDPDVLVRATRREHGLSMRLKRRSPPHGLGRASPCSRSKARLGSPSPRSPRNA